MSRYASVIYAFAMVFLATSCDSGGGNLSSAHGKVLFRGIPLSHGMIVFTPDAERGNDGPSAHAEIQKDGTFELVTDNDKGAVSGWHRITITALEDSPSGMGLRIPRSMLPDKYCDPELSGLSCEITPGKNNGINLNLD